MYRFVIGSFGDWFESVGRLKELVVSLSPSSRCASKGEEESEICCQMCDVLLSEAQKDRGRLVLLQSEVVLLLLHAARQLIYWLISILFG